MLTAHAIPWTGRLVRKTPGSTHVRYTRIGAWCYLMQNGPWQPCDHTPAYDGNDDTEFGDLYEVASGIGFILREHIAGR